jgi:Fic family protein
MWEELNRIKKEYLELDLQNVFKYEKNCMISILWHSTKIEACSLNEAETRALLENNHILEGKALTDQLLIKNHYRAFQFIKDQAKIKRRVDIEFIQEIGALVLASAGDLNNPELGSFDSTKGDLRLSQVYVNEKYFPDFKKLPALLKQLCSRFDESLDNLENERIIRLAADVHYNFVNIHPFKEGNGIIARLLMNYVQLFHDEPLIKIFWEDKSEYFKTLKDAEEKGDLNIFREFIVRQQTKFLKAEIEKFKK